MRPEGRKIFQNVLVLTGTEVAAQGLALILMMFVARKLGPALMGIHAFGLTFAMSLQIFIDFGLNSYIQRQIGRSPQSSASLLFQITVLKMGIILACAGITLALLPVMAPGYPKREVVLILVGAMFFQSNMDTICAFFRARLMAHLEAMVQIGFRLTYTVAGILFIWAGAGLITLVSLQLVGMATAFFLALGLFQRKIGRMQWDFSWPRLRQLVQSTWNFFLIRLVQTVFNSIDMLMLSIIAGDVPTGYYAAVCRLIFAFDFIPGAFSGAFLPILGRETQSDREFFFRSFAHYFRFVLLIGVGLGVILMGLSREIMVFIFGADFLPASTTLFLMAITLILTFANWPMSTAIIALDKERSIFRIFSICAGVNILLNLWLIPILQDQGAAWATILSQFLLLILQGRLLSPAVRQGAKLDSLSLRLMACGLLTWLFMHLLSFSKPGLGWSLVGSGLAFLLFAVLTGALRLSDLALAREFLTQRELKFTSSR